MSYYLLLGINTPRRSWDTEIYSRQLLVESVLNILQDLSVLDVISQHHQPKSSTMHSFLALPSLLLLASLTTATLAIPAGAAPSKPTTALAVATSASLTYSPTNSAVLIPASYPISGLVPQCNHYESVVTTDANHVQADLAIGTGSGSQNSCCTTATNQCALLDVNGTAAVQLCSTGGAQCAQCLDLATAIKSIVASCSNSFLTGTQQVGGQVVIPWMVNTTLQLNPARQSSVSEDR